LKRKAGLLAALVLVLTLGPMWAFVLDEIKHERTLTVQAARNNAMNLATAFEAHVLSTIRLMDIVLLDMREDVLEHMDFGRHVDEELKAYGGFIAQLAVIDRDGRLVFSNLGPSGKHVDLSDREHFRVHRDNPQEDRLFISKPVLGRVSKQWTIQFTRPIHQNGEFAGVLVLSVPTSFFADYYQQIDVGPNGSIVLLGTDRSVRAIASGTQIPGRYGRFKVPEDKPYFDPEAPQRGFYEGVSVIDGEYRLGAYRRLIDQGRGGGRAVVADGLHGGIPGAQDIADRFGRCHLPGIVGGGAADLSAEQSLLPEHRSLAPRPRPAGTAGQHRCTDRRQQSPGLSRRSGG